MVVDIARRKQLGCGLSGCRQGLELGSQRYSHLPEKAVWGDYKKGCKCGYT